MLNYTLRILKALMYDAAIILVYGIAKLLSYIFIALSSTIHMLRIVFEWLQAKRDLNARLNDD